MGQIIEDDDWVSIAEVVVESFMRDEFVGLVCVTYPLLIPTQIKL